MGRRFRVVAVRLQFIRVLSDANFIKIFRETKKSDTMQRTFEHNKFCYENEYKNLEEVKEFNAFYCAVKVHGGWILFQGASDFDDWKKQGGKGKPILYETSNA